MKRILELAKENGFNKMNQRSDGAYVVSEEMILSFGKSIAKEASGICRSLQKIPATEPRHCASDIEINFGVYDASED